MNVPLKRILKRWQGRTFPREFFDWYGLFVTGFGLVPLLGFVAFVLTMVSFFLAFMFGVAATGIVLIARDGNWILGSILIGAQLAIDLPILKHWLKPQYTGASWAAPSLNWDERRRRR